MYVDSSQLCKGVYNTMDGQKTRLQHNNFYICSFFVSLSLTPSVKCSAFYINIIQQTVTKLVPQRRRVDVDQNMSWDPVRWTPGRRPTRMDSQQWRHWSRTRRPPDRYCRRRDELVGGSDASSTRDASNHEHCSTDPRLCNAQLHTKNFV